MEERNWSVLVTSEKSPNLLINEQESHLQIRISDFNPARTTQMNLAGQKVLTYPVKDGEGFTILGLSISEMPSHDTTPITAELSYGENVVWQLYPEFAQELWNTLTGKV